MCSAMSCSEKKLFCRVLGFFNFFPASEDANELTGSKQIVTLLNKMGHCSSYCDVEIINTSLAQENSAQSQAYGVVFAHG